jgi:hypothetical protein
MAAGRPLAASASRPGRLPGVVAAWDTSGSRVTPATTSSGRRCSSNRRTTAGNGRSPAGRYDRILSVERRRRWDGRAHGHDGCTSAVADPRSQARTTSPAASRNTRHASARASATFPASTVMTTPTRTKSRPLRVYRSTCGAITVRISWLARRRPKSPAAAPQARTPPTRGTSSCTRNRKILSNPRPSCRKASRGLIHVGKEPSVRTSKGPPGSNTTSWNPAQGARTCRSRKSCQRLLEYPSAALLRRGRD